jgi:putative transposase
MMKNFRKEKLHVAKTHEKISTSIGETQDVVFVEDLKIRNISRSDRRTADAPWQNVRQKSGLNCSILSRRDGGSS